ncbi:ankyrin repeat-containing domain protein [Aspergillus carlsbadensis]|nr:ankyrin repeat-containing domain protein [Aspergillus carlsbadensis]
MLLLDLPGAILLGVADFLEYSWDLNSLILVNRYTHALINPYLYQHNIQYTPVSTLDCGAALGWDTVVRKLLERKVLPQEYDKHYLQKKMAVAAENGHLHVLCLFMESWARLPQSTFKRRPNLSTYLGSALFQAVTSGHDTISLLLVDYGADPTICPETWSCIADYPIAIAARRGRLPVLKRMIERGQRAQYENPIDLVGLLFRAAGGGQPNAIRYLIELGVDPNASKDGQYPIGTAAMRGGVEAVRCLLDCGADPCPTLSNGATLGPLCLAVSRGTLESAKLLLSRINTDEYLTSDRGLVPLMCCAAACGADDLVRKLLGQGCDPDAVEGLSPAKSFQFHSDRTPILWATMNSHEEVVRLLLDRGAKLDPALLACAINSKARSVSLITLLLDKGADPRECYLGSNTPVLLKALDDPVLFKLLLERGADPNHPEYLGLMMQHAIKHGGTPQVQILLDRGLQLRIPPGTSHTDGSLLRSATHGGAPMLEFLFRHGYELSTDDKNDTFSVVGLAISRHDIPALIFLLDRGVKPTTSKRYSPLFEPNVCTHETCEVIEPMLDFLLSRGLDIHAEDLSGRNCVWHALNYNGPLALTYLKTILKRGARPLSRGNASTSPLYKAVQRGLVDAVRALLELGTLHDVPRSELKAELSMARVEAKREEKWKIVRVLERFWYGHGFHLVGGDVLGHIPHFAHPTPSGGGKQHARIEPSLVN